MKITYIELDYHSECLNSFCYAFKSRKEQVAIYTSRAIYNELSHTTSFNNFTWIISDEDSVVFLKKHINTINKSDIVFIGTLQNSVSAFSSIQFTAPVILRVHSGNFHFNRNRNFSIPSGITDMIDAFRFFVVNVLLKKEFLLLNKLTIDIKNISFTSKNIPDYFHELLKNKKLNLLQSIPVETFEPIYNEPKEDSFFTIAIPGSVDVNRRDYTIVIDALKKIKQQINRPVEIYLLGKPIGYKGRRMIRYFQTLNDKTISVHSFNTEVKQTELEKIMKRTNLILCPVKAVNQHYFYKERIGFTKISGTISDIIRYGKYALVPGFYLMPERFDKIVSRYGSSDDLAERLIDSIIKNVWLSPKEAAFVFNDYSADGVYDKTMDIFKDVIAKERSTFYA